MPDITVAEVKAAMSKLCVAELWDYLLDRLDDTNGIEFVPNADLERTAHMIRREIVVRTRPEDVWPMPSPRREKVDHERDLAHEADMRKLTREQLEGEDWDEDELMGDPDEYDSDDEKY